MLSVIGFVVVGNAFNDLNNNTTVRVSPPVYTQPTPSTVAPPTTVVPPVTAPAPPPSKVTEANFNQVKKGMTFDQVRGLLGEPTEHSSHNTSSIGSLGTQTFDIYTWRAPSSGYYSSGGYAMIGFTNGTVEYMSATNLPAGAATPPSTTPALSAPAQVVQRYWDDMNTGNFQEAWNLGGSNLQSSVGSESAFAAQNGSAVGTTSVTITGASGAQVNVNLSSGGHTFFGSYTVSNGVIVSGNIQKTS